LHRREKILVELKKSFLSFAIAMDSCDAPVYEETTLHLSADDLGENRATLLRARSNSIDPVTYKAVIYLHGYSDYFFQ
jgi:hypothetical protein